MILRQLCQVGDHGSGGGGAVSTNQQIICFIYSTKWTKDIFTEKKCVFFNWKIGKSEVRQHFLEYYKYICNTRNREVADSKSNE